MEMTGLILCFFVFSGGNALVLLEGTDKITEIIKTVPVGNLRNGIIGGGNLVTCLFDPLMVQVIHRCLVGHFRKKSAEILGRHVHRGRKAASESADWRSCVQ